MNPRWPVLHIAPLDRWEAATAAGASYRDPSLDAEGFIHCSTPEQVLIPANELFAGRDDLVLLVIDPDLAEVELVFEDCYETGIEFPHLYGPVPLAAVVEVIDFPPKADGRFGLPDRIRDLVEPE